MISNESIVGTSQQQQCLTTSSTSHVAYDSIRFALICYIGTPIACIGIVSNCFLLSLFAHRRYRNSPTLYLWMLAATDALICLIYVPFFTVDALSLYLRIESLHHVWHTYVMFLYGTSRVVQFASTYMMLCATIERFILVAEIDSLRSMSTPSGRWITIVCVLILGISLRLPSYWEYKIQYDSACSSFDAYTFVPLLASRHDYFIYNFYVLQIVHVLLPFILLCILNLSIIVFMYRQLQMIDRTALLTPGTVSCALPTTVRINGRHQLKYATWTMVTIVFTYLVCNTCNVIVTVLERFGGAANPLLYHADGSSTTFYTYSADFISILVVANSCARFGIYAMCNPEFRTHIYRSMCIQLMLMMRMPPSATNTTVNVGNIAASSSRAGRVRLLNNYLDENNHQQRIKAIETVLK